MIGVAKHTALAQGPQNHAAMLWKTGRSNEGTKTEARAKVIQLDEGFHVLKPDRRVVDLG